MSTLGIFLLVSLDFRGIQLCALTISIIVATIRPATFSNNSCESRALAFLACVGATVAPGIFV